MIEDKKSQIDNQNISIDSVRKLAVYKQGLAKKPDSYSHELILEIISNIGMLQIDSINVVRRSHYLVLFSRIGHYNPLILDQLQYPERKLVEQWVNVASLINQDDFKYLVPMILMRRREPLTKRQLMNLGKDYKAVLKNIQKKIRTNGSSSADQFKEHNPNKMSWWSKKPARVALDILFRRGYIIISHRKNFKCFYDLSQYSLETYKSKSIIEFYKWVTIKSINAMGMATLEEISDYYRVKRKNIQKAIKQLKANNEIVELNLPVYKDILYTTNENLKAIK